VLSFASEQNDRVIRKGFAPFEEEFARFAASAWFMKATKTSAGSVRRVRSTARDCNLKI
jgi:hypothetical protein